MIGTSLGAYEILELLGVGGMGEVYRARDSRLQREVAIKVLPQDLSENATHVGRFEREARALAALNHPNVAAIHGLEQEGDRRFIVMELVRGEPLDQRLRRRALSVAETIDLGRRIATGLAAAHAANIIHRDIKPANIVFTPDGAPKLLDFGVAKAFGVEPLDWTTEDTALTRPGTAIGTVPYMSPEQLRGEPADERSDIWAFGCILYEALSGARAFAASTPADTVAVVLQQQPDWDAIPPGTPASLDRLVRDCLSKEAGRRPASFEDIAMALDREVAASMTPAAAPESPTARRVLPWAALAVTALLALWLSGGEAPDGPQDWSMTPITRTLALESDPSLAPDGETLVYASNEAGNWDIYSRPLSGGAPLNLTANYAGLDTHPSVSPDGGQIAFRSGREGGGIYVMPIGGGTPRRLATGGDYPSWSPDGRMIVVSSEYFPDGRRIFTDGGLSIIDVEGRVATRTLLAEGHQPAWSPGGQRIAYFALRIGGNREIFTIAADGTEAPVAATDHESLDWSPAWAADGSRLYFSSSRGGIDNIWSVAIDEDTGEVGEPRRERSSESRQLFLSVSRDGDTLLYTAQRNEGNVQRIAFDPEARAVVGDYQWLTRGANRFLHVRVSRDGDWIVYSTNEDPEDLFLQRADGSGEVRRLTDDLYRDRMPSFSPDGGSVLFMSDRSGSYEAWLMDLDTGNLRQFTHHESPAGAGLLEARFSPDGEQIAYHVADQGTYVMDADVPWLEQTPTLLPNPPIGQFLLDGWSADGKWITGWRQGQGAAAYVYSVEDNELIGPLLERHVHLVMLDEDTFLFEQATSIQMLDRSTGEIVELLPAGEGYDLWDRLEISTDRRWIYVIRTDNTSDIYMLQRSD